MVIEEQGSATSGEPSRREWQGWELRETGPATARRVLLLPGGLGTAAFYDDVLTRAGLGEHDVRLIATTPPGFGGRPAPADLSVPGYANLAADAANELGCELVVGHSYFATVVAEMAATRRFTGKVMLLAPAFSRPDEEQDVRTIDRLARIPGLRRPAWSVVARSLDSSMRGRLPAARHDELVAAMRSSDMAVVARIVRSYFDHLAAHADLPARLAGAGNPAWVVRGDHDEIGLTDTERHTLQTSPTITLITIPDAAHFVMLDQPAQITELIVRATVT